MACQDAEKQEHEPLLQSQQSYEEEATPTSRHRKSSIIAAQTPSTSQQQSHYYRNPSIHSKTSTTRAPSMYHDNDVRHRLDEIDR
jgi:hypothetical protein